MANQSQVQVRGSKIIRKFGIAEIACVKANKHHVAYQVEGTTREVSAKLRDVFGAPSRYYDSKGNLIREFTAPDHGLVQVRVDATLPRSEHVTEVAFIAL